MIFSDLFCNLPAKSVIFLLMLSLNNAEKRRIVKSFSKNVQKCINELNYFTWRIWKKINCRFVFIMLVVILSYSKWLFLTAPKLEISFVEKKFKYWEWVSLKLSKKPLFHYFSLFLHPIFYSVVVLVFTRSIMIDSL